MDDDIVPLTVCHPLVENATEGSTLDPAEVDGEPVDPRIGWCPNNCVNYFIGIWVHVR